MNQEPNNPVAPNLVTPPEAPINPAAAAAPTLDPTPTFNTAPAMSPEANVTPEAPAMPEAPTLDPSLLQQAIADVPEEAAATTPDIPSAVTLNSLGNATEQPAAPAEASPFTGAAPSANFAAPEAEPSSMPTDPTTGAPVVADEATKTTPSVAFNDPAQQPDAAKHGKDIDLGKLLETIKQRPVLAIVGGGALIIIILVLILAFAI